MLKCDLHMHTNNVHPRFDSVIKPKELIDLAARNRFDVIAITEHATIAKFFNRIRFYPDALRTYRQFKGYAKKKGILLIPGIEIHVEGKEILLINFTGKIKDYSLSDIESIKGENVCIIAPHPFYPRGSSLGKRLEDNIRLFDAIEHSHFYTTYYNPNRKVLELAKRFKKPVVASSDAHFRIQVGTNYTLVDAENNIDSVLEAVEKNRIRMVTRPLSTPVFAWLGFKALEGLIGKEFM